MPRTASSAMSSQRRSSRSMTTPLNGSISKAGMVCSISSVPKAISECVFCRMNQVTPAEFMPLPIMEIRLAAKMSRIPLCCKMLRMSLSL